MKKIYTLLMMTFMVTTFTSCEREDEQIARTLEGNWEGTMNEYFYSRWGNYLTGSRCYTYFQFVRTNSTSGYGTERDQDEYGNEIERSFTWNVNYEYGYDYYSDYFDIYLRYDSRYYVYDAFQDQEYEYRSGFYDAVIYDAYLSSNSFSGKMEGSDGALRQFYLRYSSGLTRAAKRSSMSKKPVIIIDKTKEQTDTTNTRKTSK